MLVLTTNNTLFLLQMPCWDFSTACCGLCLWYCTAGRCNRRLSLLGWPVPVMRVARQVASARLRNRSRQPPTIRHSVTSCRRATSCRTTSTDDTTAVSPSFWAYVVESTELRSDAIELRLRRSLDIVCGALAGSLFRLIVVCPLWTI